MDLDEGQNSDQYSSDVAIFYEIITQVDWSEPWLMVLIGAHLAVFILIICSRGRVNTLAVLLAVLGVLCLGSKHINEWCAENWERFSRYQYFDSAGLFTSIVFSLPILFNCIVILILLFIESCTIMQKVAIARIRQREGQRRRMRKSNPSPDQNKKEQ